MQPRATLIPTGTKGIDEMSHTFDQRTVTTRKPHKCWGCTAEFPSGSRMVYVVSVDAGVWYRTYWCETCDDVVSSYSYNDRDAGFHFGDIKANDAELWAEMAAERASRQTPNTE